MSAPKSSPAARSRRIPWQVWVVLVLAALAGAIAYLRPAVTSGPAGYPGGLPLRMHAQPQVLPEMKVLDGEGRAFELKSLRGKVVLLNVWATWCPPCRQEMPSLDRLQGQLGGKDFEVVALSVDAGPAGLKLVKAFYAEMGIKNLAVYQDAQASAVFQLKAVGVPTTLLLDREGRELGRMSGTAEWDSPQIVAALRGQIMARP